MKLPWSSWLARSLTASTYTHGVMQDVILAWHDKAAAAQVLGVTADVAAAVRDAAAPFVEWLKEASDEDEDSDDEE